MSAGAPGLRMGLRTVVRACAVVLAAGWLSAAQAAPVDDLSKALRLQELAMLMRDEGIADARDIIPTGPSGRPPQAAVAEIETLFDPDRFRTELQAALAASMSTEELAEAAAFFDSADGAALVELELVARSAIADPEVEAIARSEWAARQGDDDPEIRLLEQFAEVNGLVERNTTTTMTARYHFLLGVAEGAGRSVDEGHVLSEVWADEARIRTETEAWLMGYLLLAYGPAGERALQAYVDFSATAAGQAVNAALFDGFETAYGRISRGLGLVAGRASMAQDL